MGLLAGPKRSADGRAVARRGRLLLVQDRATRLRTPRSPVTSACAGSAHGPSLTRTSRSRRARRGARMTGGRSSGRRCDQIGSQGLGRFSSFIVSLSLYFWTGPLGRRLPYFWHGGSATDWSLGLFFLIAGYTAVCTYMRTISHSMGYSCFWSHTTLVRDTKHSISPCITQHMQLLVRQLHAQMLS
jgi:hypothetical protein